MAWWQWWKAPRKYDLDGDGFVSGSDLSAIESKLGLTTMDPGFDRRMDFDGDGTISVRDKEALGRWVGTAVR